MLAGKKCSQCTACYRDEDSGNSSFRKHSNEQFEKYIDNAIATTNIDGTIDDFKLRYLDVRWSNICNFKCRMCGPGLSSSWYDDYIAIHGKRGQEFLDERIFKHTDPMSKFTPEDLDTVEHLMIGGGEPFITEDFWKLIDSFSNEQKKQISFYGNTNGSVTKFKSQNCSITFFPNPSILKASLETMCFSFSLAVNLQS